MSHEFSDNYRGFYKTVENEYDILCEFDVVIKQLIHNLTSSLKIHLYVRFFPVHRVSRSLNLLELKFES